MAIQSQQDYIFDSPKVLGDNTVKLTVTRGDAWVFTGNCNFIMHTGEERFITAKNRPTIVRRAYTRGFAKVQVEVVA